MCGLGLEVSYQYRILVRFLSCIVEFYLFSSFFSIFAVLILLTHVSLFTKLVFKLSFLRFRSKAFFRFVGALYRAIFCFLLFFTFNAFFKLFSTRSPVSDFKIPLW